MAFDSLVEALASSAETADKIKFVAGYVGTYFVAFTIVCGVPYCGYRLVSSKLAAKRAKDRTGEILNGQENAPKYSKEDEDAFDFNVGTLTETYQTLFFEKREEHLVLWNQYGISKCVEKQAHFTQIVMNGDAVVEGDAEETLKRLTGMYWLIGTLKNVDITLDGNPFDETERGADNDSEDDVPAGFPPFK